MAFLLMLQRLDPGGAPRPWRRGVRFRHQEIAALVGQRRRQPQAPRARQPGRRFLRASTSTASSSTPLCATTGGDVAGLVSLLAPTQSWSPTAAPPRSVAGQRNLARPLAGAERVAALMVARLRAPVGVAPRAVRELNGQPAIVFWAGATPPRGVRLAVADGRIHRAYFHAERHAAQPSRRAALRAPAPERLTQQRRDDARRARWSRSSRRRRR